MPTLRPSLLPSLGRGICGRLCVCPHTAHCGSRAGPRVWGPGAVYHGYKVALGRAGGRLAAIPLPTVPHRRPNAFLFLAHPCPTPAVPCKVTGQPPGSRAETRGTCFPGPATSPGGVSLAQAPSLASAKAGKKLWFPWGGSQVLRGHGDSSQERSPETQGCLARQTDAVTSEDSSELG